jgi:predicted AAA+ superfamily ATPase
MNTQERWNYIKNNDEIIRQYMAQHDEEVQTRKLVKFLKGADTMDFDIEYLVIRLHDIAREVEQRVGVGELSRDIRACADRLGDCNKAVK